MALVCISKTIQCEHEGLWSSIKENNNEGQKVAGPAADGIAGLYLQKCTIWRNSRSRIVNMEACEVLWMRTLAGENNNDGGRACS